MKKLNVIIFLLCMYNASYTMNNSNDNEKPFFQRLFKDQLYALMALNMVLATKDPSTLHRSLRKDLNVLFSPSALFLSLDLENKENIGCYSQDLKKGLCKEFIFRTIHLNLADHQNLTKLSSDIEHSTTLLCLNLSNNSLKTIPDEFDQLSYLELLNLNQNQLNDLPPTIYRHTTLKTVYLVDNPISTNQNLKKQIEAQKRKGLNINWKKLT